MQTLTTEQTKETSAESSARRIPLAAVALGALILIVAVKLLCFFPFAGKIGFYLDDWTKIVNLSFSDRSFWSLFLTGIQDPTEVSRPIQPLYYACLYSLFGNEPFGYHLFSYIADALCGWFLFLALSRLSGSRFLSLLSAMLLVLCPLHDSTNNWVGANLVVFSLMLYSASLWLLIRSRQEKNRANYVGSILLFSVSAFCYEAFLPLTGTLFVSLLLLEGRAWKSFSVGLRSLLAISPFIFISLSLVAYQRLLLPKLTKAFLPPLARGDASHFVDVMMTGFSSTLGPAGWSFAFQRASDVMPELGTAEVFRVVAIGLLSILALFFLSARKDNMRASLVLSVLGLSTIFFSYTVFGVARDYIPNLDSLWNRTNIGASFGLAMALCGFVGVGANWLATASRTQSESPRLRAAVILCLVSPLLMLWTIANIGLSKPWQLSWVMQKEITKRIVERKSELTDKDQLLLVNTPRYVMWAPLFDGVWDFQPMVHLTTGNRAIEAGVVSERLQLDGAILRDVSMKFECARYDTRGLKLLWPTSGIETVRGPAEFVKSVEERGMTFGLAPSAVKKWRASLESSSESL